MRLSCAEHVQYDGSGGRSRRLSRTKIHNSAIKCISDKIIAIKYHSFCGAYTSAIALFRCLVVASVVAISAV